MSGIAIIGSGMAGFGAYHRLQEEGLSAVIYEQADHPGGHTWTHTYEGGWSFDEGPHVSFTKEPRIQALLAEGVGGAYRILRANVDNYWRGYRIKHPAQCNLYGLPTDLVVACLKDFIEVSARPPQAAATYAEWLTQAYGKTFAETFPMEYARKVHTTEPESLTTEWLGPRLYRPSLDEVLRGAVGSDTGEFHYVTEYRYPLEGGFFAYLRPFLRAANLCLGQRLVEVDPTSKQLRFESGTATDYDYLISSVPLPELVPMIRGVPAELRAAAGRLAATSMLLVNVGIDREDVGDTWTYFYDPDVSFARVSYPSRLSPTMAPPGCGSFQCEIYFSDKYKPRLGPPESFIATAIGDLRRCGLIREGDRIMHQSAIAIRYANIIHDHDKAPALDLIHRYLKDLGIRICGRYGLWGYQWTDEAFASGEAAAQQVIESL